MPIGLDRVESRKSLREGAILRFQTAPCGRGNTSVQFQLEIYADIGA